MLNHHDILLSFRPSKTETSATNSVKENKPLGRFKLESGSHEKDLQRPHVKKCKQFVLASTSSKDKPDQHICLRCGSEISQGRDFYRKRYWRQKHSMINQNKTIYAKHIVPLSAAFKRGRTCFWSSVD